MLWEVAMPTCSGELDGASSQRFNILVLVLVQRGLIIATRDQVSQASTMRDDVMFEVAALVAVGRSRGMYQDYQNLLYDLGGGRVTACSVLSKNMNHCSRR